MRGADEILLVVEDHELRSVLTDLLREHDHVVAPVATVDDARTSLSRVTPSLLLVDAPASLEAVRALLAELAVRSEAPPTLLLSEVQELLEVADDFGVEHLEKPFGRYAFVEALRRARACGKRPSQPRQRVAGR